jgi:hypothetical protein
MLATPDQSFNRQQWGMPPSGPPLHDVPAFVIPHRCG